LAAIRKHLNEDLDRQRGIYVGLISELERHNIYIYDFDELGAEDQDYLIGYFKRKVFPVLTPLSVDPGHPFPFISNLSYSLGIMLKNPQTGMELFSRVKIPEVIPGLIQLPRSEEDI